MAGQVERSLQLELQYGQLHSSPAAGVFPLRLFHIKPAAGRLRLPPTGHTHSEVSVPYANRCGEQKKLSVDSAFLEVRKEIQHLKHQLGILSIVDVVWNHTSFDTTWLIQVREEGRGGEGGEGEVWSLNIRQNMITQTRDRLQEITFLNNSASKQLSKDQHLQRLTVTLPLIIY